MCKCKFFHLKLLTKFLNAFHFLDHLNKLGIVLCPVKQIQDILGTYAQQEKYLVTGLYPNVDVDKELYKTKMEEAWGDHYLQLDDEIDHSPSNKAGREDIAAAVFEKLQDLGYLPTGE